MEPTRFRPANQYQKKIDQFRQGHEYTHVDKYFEGLCYACWSKRYVKASIFDICKRCMDKRGNEAIMALAGRKVSSYCFFCETYHRIVWVVNARICQRCNNIIARAHKRYRLTGRYNIDPFYKKLRREYGKDWQELAWNTSPRL